MSLIVTEVDMLGALADLLAAWAGKRRIGLFQNDWTPTPSSGISEVQPCDFSGYAGLQTLTGWTTPTLYGETAITSADQVVWTYNGGPAKNWVFGYYVVDNTGALRWAERNPNGSVALVVAGNTFPVVPAFSFGSKFR